MTERGPVSETLCSLEYRKMDKVQKLSNPENKRIKGKEKKRTRRKNNAEE
jgi:hypothetical protein